MRAALITPEYRQESLTRAYVLAVAGHVGLSHAVPTPDCGIDLTLRQVTKWTNPRTGKRQYVDSGAVLDIQLKSTTKGIVCDAEVHYDLKVKAYDSLREERVSTPRILVLHIQPEEEHERLQLTEKGLTLGVSCFIGSGTRRGLG